MMTEAPRRVAPHWAPFVALVLLGLLPASAWPDGPAFFDGRGFDPARGTVSEFAWEHVDPLTGNLLLTFTDLSLPGDGGLGLQVQRTYNSKIYSDLGQNLLGEISWAGLGWSLHMGRVFVTQSCGPPLGPSAFETPDGNEHPLYLHPDNNGSHYQTRELWTYDQSGSTPKLRMANGLVYTFGNMCVPVQFGSNQPSRTAHYATRIEDPFGNRIDVSYNAGVVKDTINTITQTMTSGDVRAVRFLCGPSHQVCAIGNRQLSEVALLDQPGGSPTNTWAYTQTAVQGLSFLTEAQPPEGPAWEFAYYTQGIDPVPWSIESVTTPNGGVVSYAHERHDFVIGSNPWKSPAVITRTVGGRLPSGGGGNWAYLYERLYESPPGAYVNRTTVTSPCGTKTIDRFLDIDFSVQQPQAWRLGALESKEVGDSNNTWEKETLTWIASPPISKAGVPQGSDIYTRAPLLQQRQIQRPGQGSYTTTYTYDLSLFDASRANNFADYGRPYQIDESGELARMTLRAFFYDPSNHYNGFGAYLGSYVVDKTDTETTTVGTDSYVNDYGYRTTGGYKGFPESQTIRGITTTFTPFSPETGNAQTATDANQNTTTYTYDWGVQRNVTTPEYAITRLINPDGTVHSETRRGFTTTFDYDDLFRLTKQTPDPSVAPQSNPTNIQYATDGTFVKTSRGSSYTQTTIDGFGRPADTVNSISVRTQVLYDGCGRTIYESYPFEGALTSGNNKGDDVQYDPLDRPTRRTHPDGKYVRFEYSGSSLGNGIDVGIYDEENRHGFQDWSAFGDPRDGRLMSVQAAIGTADANTTDYTYNGLGSIKTMTPVGASQLSRTWTYYGPNQSGGTPGLLESETNPENGEVSYTYDAVGNVRTRTDARYGPNLFTRFCYDGNNRLLRVAFPTTSTNAQCDSYDKLFVYDDSNNRTHDESPGIASDFSFDGVNRLKTRVDNFDDGTSFTTTYTPDSNDNVQDIIYPGPSPRTVRYAYDNENRVRSAGTGQGGNNTYYASNALYHPSGALKSFGWGNGGSTTLTYDADRYWIRSISASPGVIALGYNLYDGVGNVGSTTDDQGASYSQSLSYDSLDRLLHGGSTALGVWDYTYNSRGDRRSKTKNGTSTINYTYGDGTNNTPANNWLLQADTTSFGYDDNGNMTSDQIYIYTYTPENLLETVTPVGGAPTTSYTYDASGFRTRKIQNGSVTQAHYFIHGTQGQLLSEFVRCGSSALAKGKDYVYLGQRLLATLDFTGLPEVAFPNPAQLFTEAAGPQLVPVAVATWDGCPLGSGVTVGYSGVNGTATAGSDFTITPGTLTFPAGSVSGALQNVPVTILNDVANPVVEPNETFTIPLANPTGAVLGAASTATVTIQDDDGTVAFSSAAMTVSENVPGGVATARVNLVTSNNLPLSNNIVVNYDTQNGTATAGNDYTATSGSLNFNIGESTGAFRDIAIPIVNDTTSECDDEFFNARITGVQGGLLGAPAIESITILDDDFAAVSVGPLTVTEGNSGTAPALVPVTLSQPSCKIVNVNYATSDGSAVSSGAHPDYVAASGTLTISSFSTSTTVTVNVIGDTVHEVTESFNVTLSNPVNATLGQAQAAVTIQDNDAPPSLSIATGLPPTPPEGDEGTTPAPFIVSMSGNLSEPQVTVNYATADGTATAAQPDYLTTSGVMSFPPFSSASQTIMVPIVGDSFDEPDENYFVNLSNPVHATLGTAQATGGIADDDPPPVSSTELFHGVDLTSTLNGGYPTTVDYFRIGQKPYASYEVVVDGATAGDGFIEIERVDANLVRIGAPSVPIGGTGGFSRSLRWRNWPGTSQSVGVTNESIRVARWVCAPTCGRYTYRLSLLETTYSITRFNNTGGQTTTVVLQNNGKDVVNGLVHFWDASGSLLASVPLGGAFSYLNPKQTYSFDTSSVAGLAGQAGSITVSNDGRYGVLSGKAVAIEPASGRVFETTLEPRR